MLTGASGVVGLEGIHGDAGVALLFHPAIELGSQLGDALGLGGVVGEVVHLVGIGCGVVKLLDWASHVALDQLVGVRVFPGIS